MSDSSSKDSLETRPLNFIEQIIADDLKTGKHQQIVTRFPPEPNGYLHIGHAKAICLNFGLVNSFPGKCYLRFDDTNPLKEEDEFVKAIIEDIKWLGFEWCAETYSSDYYEKLYEFAIHLIKKGLAYVDSLSPDEIRAHRGTLQEPGKDSPYRTRSIDENLDLFTKMRAGEFADGEHVLRAKIDMSSGNINMRDPVIYRIRHAHHQRTGDAWCIYPMYDYAHPLSDALEYVTHSLCSLEFQDHRPLYDWFVDNTPTPAKPIQTEFARLNISHTVTSKRKLRELVEDKIVDGWDDPRLPTLKGMRSRGYPPAAIRKFCEIVGVSRSDSVIDLSILEDCVRDELNAASKRVLAVFDPLKIVIENYPEGECEILKAPFYPQDKENTEARDLPFAREIYIDRSDFMEDPPKKFFRLAVGKEVRLRHAYIIKCEDVVRDADGNVIELRCTYDKDTLGKNPEDRKVKGVIQWVASEYAKPFDIQQFDRLFMDENPAREDDFKQFINDNSLTELKAFCEPAVAKEPLGAIMQFERLGYYKVNKLKESTVTSLHRIVELRSAWDKIKAK